MHEMLDSLHPHGVRLMRSLLKESNAYFFPGFRRRAVHQEPRPQNDWHIESTPTMHGRIGPAPTRALRMRWFVCNEITSRGASPFLARFCVFDHAFLLERIQNRVEKNVSLLLFGSYLDGILRYQFEGAPIFVM